MRHTPIPLSSSKPEELYDGEGVKAKPVRIQRKRVKGWRMPMGIVYVGRGSIWGNPFVIGAPSGVFPEGMGANGRAEVLIPALSLTDCLTYHENAVSGIFTPEMYPAGHRWSETFRKRFNGMTPKDAARQYLRGKSICCWCGEDEACHGDTWLEIANS